MSGWETIALRGLLDVLFTAEEEPKRASLQARAEGKPTRNERLTAKIRDVMAEVRAGNLDALRTMVTSPKHANWHIGSNSLLDVAVRENDPKTVLWLLDHGADPNTLFFQDDSRQTHRRLTKQGMYFSPFATAIQTRSDDVALLLFERGARLDLPVIWCGKDDCRSCRELAEDEGLWPCFEAVILARAASVGSVRPSVKRL